MRTQRPLNSFFAHREHLAEDDKLIEKLHRDAVEGKLRAKRRNRGVEISEGSDESDDEHDREIRRKLRKKRKIDGDALEALGQYLIGLLLLVLCLTQGLGNNEDTRAFYDAYRQDLDDDDNAEFSHLQSNDMVIEGGHSELEADAEGDAETEAETERFFPLRMPQKRRFAFQHLEVWI
jgi:mediator of replication checkpoint protein 1